jgi:uncharacterized membrane protein YeiH
VLRAEIYAVWAIVAGIAVGTKLASAPIELYILFVVVALLRILAYTYHWKLPHRSLRNQAVDQ